MNQPRSKREEESSAAIVHSLGLILAMCVSFTLAAFAADPAWWPTRRADYAPQVVTNSGVVTTNYLSNAATAITQGQLKLFTSIAISEMNVYLPGGAGPDLNSMVANRASDYATNIIGEIDIKPSNTNHLNVGQVKYVGNKVWSRLVAAGYTNAVPSWLAQNTNSDSQVANLGQLKTVFNFDLSTVAVAAPMFRPGAGTYALAQTVTIKSISAGATIYYTTDGSTPTTNSALMKSGSSIGVSASETIKAMAVVEGRIPVGLASAAYVIDPSIQMLAPTLQVVSGNGQSGPAGTLLPAPLVVRVINAQGSPMASHSLHFTIARGSGQIAATATGSLHSTLNVSTDSNGLAKVYLNPAGSLGNLNQVKVTPPSAWASGVVFHAKIARTSSGIDDPDDSSDTDASSPNASSGSPKPTNGLYPPLSTSLLRPATWTATGNLHFARRYATATLLSNGQVLMAGGREFRFLFTAELYDPTTGNWTVTGQLHGARAYHTATLLPNGQILVAGGLDVVHWVATAELYNPATALWTSTGNMPGPRYGHAATLLNNGKVLVTGGEDASGDLKSALLYDPATGTWSATGSMNIARMTPSATLLSNGQVLVVGGTTGVDTRLNSAELYNPSTGVWTLTGTMSQPRALHTATLLTSGQVLVAGGGDVQGPELGSSELYTFSTGLWTKTGEMVTPRYEHTATLLQNGQVVVAGGIDYSRTTLTSAEIFDPITSKWSATTSLPVAHHDGSTATLLNNGLVLVAGGGFNNSGFPFDAQLYKGR